MVQIGHLIKTRLLEVVCVSIFGILTSKGCSCATPSSIGKLPKKLRHRGPDWSGIYASDKVFLAFERLGLLV